MAHAQHKISEQWQAAMEDKIKVVRAALGDDAGKAFLQLLEDTFQRHKLFEESTTRMAYNIGQFELVQYLKELVEAGKADE